MDSSKVPCYATTDSGIKVKSLEILPTQLSLGGRTSSNMERRQAVEEPLSRHANGVNVGRVLSIVREGKVLTTLMNPLRNRCARARTRRKMAHVIPVKEFYKKFYYDTQSWGSKVSCKTVSDVESHFPFEWDGKHHVIVDPETQESVLPSTEHIRDKLTDDQKMRLDQVLESVKDVFAKNNNDLGCTRLLQHNIELTPDAEPWREALRRLSPEKLAHANEQLQNLLDMGVVVPSKSPWSSALVIVKKKGGQWRMCVDFRRLNDMTIKDAFPLPRIDDSIAKLGSAKYYSSVNVSNAF